MCRRCFTCLLACGLGPSHVAAVQFDDTVSVSDENGGGFLAALSAAAIYRDGLVFGEFPVARLSKLPSSTSMFTALAMCPSAYSAAVRTSSLVTAWVVSAIIRPNSSASTLRNPIVCAVQPNRLHSIVIKLIISGLNVIG